MVHLQDLALQPTEQGKVPAVTLSPAQYQLAMESLQLVGYKSSDAVQSATDLLTEIRVLRLHEPLDVLRNGLGPDFPAKFENEAKVRLCLDWVNADDL